MYMEWVLLAQMGFALARPSPASHTDLSERTTLSSEENSTSTYESSELSITRRSGALTRRATLYECESDQAKSSPDKTQLVEDALHWCGVLAGYGKRAAQDTSNTNFETWFRNDDQATREHVAKVYEEIENECGGHNEQSKTGILCKDQETSPGKMGCDYREGMEMYFDAKTRKQKKLKIIAWAWEDYDTIVLCPHFFKDTVRLKPKETDSDQGSLATTMLHEMTHLKVIRDPPTSDYAYEPHMIKKLPYDQAVNNANTYSKFAADEYIKARAAQKAAQAAREKAEEAERKKAEKAAKEEQKKAEQAANAEKQGKSGKDHKSGGRKQGKPKHPKLAQFMKGRPGK